MFEEKHVEVRVHDARKARSRESIKPAMVDETRTAKLYPSLRLKEDPSHAPAVKDETLQDATESTKGPSETQKNETIEEKFIRTDRETAHPRQGQRE